MPDIQAPLPPFPDPATPRSDAQGRPTQEWVRFQAALEAWIRSVHATVEAIP